MMKTKVLLTVVMAFLIAGSSMAQAPVKKYFSLASPAAATDKNYGSVTVAADKLSVVIGTIMAYGENVKGLTIRVNNGFVFKLAPSQNGSILNYVGSSLDIVLQPGDKALIEFINVGKGTGVKQLHVSARSIDQ